MIETQCPSPETLRQWTSGDTDEASANELAEHLRQCAQCQNVMAAQDDRDSDSLVQQLKADDPVLAFRDEHDCQQASILAMGAITGQAMEETHTAMPVFPKEMDDYRLLELIASGGMGKVYRAHHQRLGRDVAIKIISGRRLADANASLRFEQEIRALGRLSHPNIVAALDARQADGSPILIMEYVDGLDLSQIVKRLGALPAASVAAIGRAVAAAIAYASSNGLVHRDIKPSNIMINGKGEVKLLDLGLARIQLDGHVAPEWTGTGLAVGTPDYMSPEQINDAETINSQSDIYSLGCTLYRLLVGQAPYGGSKYRSNFEKLAAHVAVDPIRIPNAKGQYPAGLVSIIERLLSKSPADRPGCAQEVALELEKLCEGADLVGLLSMARKLQTADSSPASSSPEQQPAKSASGSGRFGSALRWIAALGGIPIGIALGIWITVRNPDGSENKVQVPKNANASVDNQGNIQIDLANATSAQRAIGPASTIGQDTGNPLAFSAIPKEAAVSEKEIDDLITTGPSNQPLYRGHSFDEWAAAMLSERSLDVQKIIVNALITLAENPDQKSRAMKLILEKSRSLGGKAMGSSGNSEKWMEILNNDTVDQLFPQPFFEEATTELTQANERSLQAILFIVQTSEVDKLLEFELQKSGNSSRVLYHFVEALSAAHARLQSSNGYSIEPSAAVADRILHIAARFDFPYPSLASDLQAASKAAWTKFQKATPNSGGMGGMGMVQTYSWVPYWATLPQQDQKKQFLVQWMCDRSIYPPDIPKVIFRHFGRFTSEEQSAIFALLAQKYRSTYNTLGAYDIDWEAAVDCLRRCSNLEPAKIDELQKILEHRRPKRVTGGMGGGMVYGRAPGHAPTDINATPERVAELLGVTLPPEQSAPQQFAPPTGFSGHTRPIVNAQDAELNNWIKASESSGKPLYRGFPFDTWLKALENERDAKAQLAAGEAVLTLAESAEQKTTVAKAVLRASRYLGGVHYEGAQDDSSKWMAMLVSKFNRFFPDPFLNAAIEEVPNGNIKSVYAILTVCRRAAKEQYYLEKVFNDNGLPTTARDGGWKKLVQELSSFKDREGLAQDERKYLNIEICALADHVDIPYSELDSTLQEESKRLWEAALLKTLHYDATSRQDSGTAWLPYWMTLPQKENHKPFMVRAVFANLDRVQNASQKVFEHFDTLTADEQTEICEFLLEQFKNISLSGAYNTDTWEQTFDCLRRCSTIDDKNLDEAAKMVAQLKSEQEYSIRNRGMLTNLPIDVAKFRELLGLPPDVGPSGPGGPGGPGVAPGGNTGAHQTKPDAKIDAIVRASESTGQPLFRGFPFDSWMKTLENEHDAAAQITAGEAVIALAQSDEEKLAAAKLILRKSRELGGLAVGDVNDSAKWMSMLRTNVYKLLPDPLLSAMIEELPQANDKSTATVISICRGFNQQPYYESGFLSDDLALLKSPLWESLLIQLSNTAERRKSNLAYLSSEFILKETLLLANRLDVPYAKLDSRLQNESKRLWETLANGGSSIEPHVQYYTGICEAAWLPYWFSLPQSENQKAILLETIFLNIDNVRTDTLRILNHFDKFTADEQRDICSVLVNHYDKFDFGPGQGIEYWKMMFDCLLRCSSLDNADLNKAFQTVHNLIETKRGIEAYLTAVDQGSLPPDLQPDVFHKLLGAPYGENFSNAPVPQNDHAPVNLKYAQPENTQPTPANTDAELRALMKSSESGKSLYRGYSFDDWLKALDADRSGEMQLLAGEAIITLAETPEEKLQAAKAVLRKSRELGGYLLAKEDFTLPWHDMLQAKVRRLFPEAFLSAAIEEVKERNPKSIMTILMLCVSPPYSGFSGVEISNAIFVEQLITSGDDAAIRRSDWEALVVEVSKAAASMKLKTETEADSKYILEYLTCLAGRLDIDFKTLDPQLQAESLRLWEKAIKKHLPSSNTPSQEYFGSYMAPWLPYWKTLAADQQRRSFVATAILSSNRSSNGLFSKYLKHFGPLTPQEQKEFCELLVMKYHAHYAMAGYGFDAWKDAFDCLRRSNGLDKSNIDKAETMVAKLDDLRKQWTASQADAKARQELAPDLFAKLLNVTLPAAKPANPNNPQGNAAAVQATGNATVKINNSSNNEKSQAPQEDVTFAWVKAGESSKKPLYKGYSLDTWIKALEREQSIDLVCQAGQAAMTVAANEEEKKSAAKAILIKSRLLGGFKSGDNNDSQKWLTLLNQNAYRIFPEAFLDEAAIEVQQANKNSILAILNVCLNETNKIKYSEGLTKQQSAAWRALVAELSRANEHFVIESFDKKYPNSLLAQTLILSQRAAISFEELDERLQSEAKRLWDAANAKPFQSSQGNQGPNVPTTPWLGYWMSLPQLENDKPFMIKAMFANLDGARLSSTMILAHFKKFSVEEQQDVFNVLAESYANYERNVYDQDEIWQEIVECLKRCSNLDQSKFTEISSALKTRRDRSYGRQFGIDPGRFPKPATDEEFRQMLGLAPKSKPASTSNLDGRKHEPLNALQSK